MSFCIGLANLIGIGQAASELRRHTDFSRWRT